MFKIYMVLKSFSQQFDSKDIKDYKENNKATIKHVRKYDQQKNTNYNNLQPKPMCAIRYPLRRNVDKEKVHLLRQQYLFFIVEFTRNVHVSYVCNACEQVYACISNKT
eukprot:TRINITY_DN5528_c0_g1_i1.p3 TRINITY_DN5528_c0_g1~~TRINITY_DN5528_c0_g1_i1.p3  ORF type:complete len:108 (-),score=1.65 TRINITY_DN5528_c0_g1_i1:60-383(-)